MLLIYNYFFLFCCLFILFVLSGVVLWPCVRWTRLGHCTTALLMSGGRDARSLVVSVFFPCDLIRLCFQSMNDISASASTWILQLGYLVAWTRCKGACDRCSYSCSWALPGRPPPTSPPQFERFSVLGLILIGSSQVEPDFYHFKTSMATQG